MEDFGSPTLLLHRGFDVTKHLLNPNFLAEIPADIFAEALHGCKLIRAC
jgi:hypothetical protein